MRREMPPGTFVTEAGGGCLPLFFQAHKVGQIIGVFPARFMVQELGEHFATKVGPRTWNRGGGGESLAAVMGHFSGVRGRHKARPSFPIN